MAKKVNVFIDGLVKECINIFTKNAEINNIKVL